MIKKMFNRMHYIVHCQIIVLKDVLMRMIQEGYHCFPNNIAFFFSLSLM